jgi:hypothetical protein
MQEFYVKKNHEGILRLFRREECDYEWSLYFRGIYKPHMHMTERCDWNQINRKVSVSTSADCINKTD